MRLFVVLFALAAAAAPAVKTTSPSPRETQVVMTFDAPRALVFDALTRCELMTRWYAPTGWSLDNCDIKLQEQGPYRLQWRRPSGTQIAAYGVYTSVEPPARVVRTEAFEPAWPGGGLVSTTTLTERDGRTTLTITLLYENAEARASDASSAEHGAQESFVRLAALLAELRKADR
jgi:uncharacterized protein YndB with AHSA1/START domain